jgi:hypothetical protein
MEMGMGMNVGMGMHVGIVKRGIIPTSATMQPPIGPSWITTISIKLVKHFHPK